MNFKFKEKYFFCSLEKSSARVASNRRNWTLHTKISSIGFRRKKSKITEQLVFFKIQWMGFFHKIQDHRTARFFQNPMDGVFSQNPMESSGSERALINFKST
jgi:hypothetical protein